MHPNETRPEGVVARVLAPDELPNMDLAPVIDPTAKPPDYTSMDEDELAQAEPDIIASLWDADHRSKQQVGRIDVPRLIVPQYDLVGGTWKARRHGAAPHLHWQAEPAGWVTVGQSECEERAGAVVMGAYTYRVRGLMPVQFETAETKASRRVLNNAGMEVGRRRDTNVYNAMLVWLATVPEDRQKPGGWDDPRIYDKYAVGNGVEVVQEILLMGELLQAISVILHLSRFAQQAEEILGNS